MKEFKLTTYKYGMRLRGYSPGAQPRQGLINVDDGTDYVERYGRYYHSILTYDRKLTEHELFAYELDDLTGIDLKPDVERPI